MAILEAELKFEKTKREFADASLELLKASNKKDQLSSTGAGKGDSQYDEAVAAHERAIVRQDNALDDLINAEAAYRAAAGLT